MAAKASERPQSVHGRRARTQSAAAARAGNHAAAAALASAKNGEADEAAPTLQRGSYKIHKDQNSINIGCSKSHLHSPHHF